MPVNAFSLAHTFTAKWEGGLVDHPADPGGITNHGVSLTFLRDYAAKPDNREWLDRLGVRLPVTPETIRALTPDHARHIFKRAFWDRLELSAFPALPAICQYDAAVNTGIRQSVLLLQRTCNDLIVSHDQPPLVVDGLIGPKTRARAHECVPAALALRMLARRREFYEHLTCDKPGLAVFLGGWLNRVDALRIYIDQLEANHAMV